MNGLLTLLAFSDSSKAIKVNLPLQETSSERSVDTQEARPLVMMNKLQLVMLLTSNETNRLQNSACLYRDKNVSAVHKYYPRHHFTALPMI
jgi:hypothetical protein